jgi:hypothetical protein
MVIKCASHQYLGLPLNTVHDNFISTHESYSLMQRFYSQVWRGIPDPLKTLNMFLYKNFLMPLLKRKIEEDAESLDAYPKKKPNIFFLHKLYNLNGYNDINQELQGTYYACLCYFLLHIYDLRDFIVFCIPLSIHKRKDSF